MLTQKEFAQRALTAVALVAGAVLLILTFGQIWRLLVTVFTAWLLAVTLEVPIRWLQRQKIPRGLAVFAVLVGLIVVFAVMGALIVPSFTQQIDSLLSDLPHALQVAAENYSDLRDNSRLAERILPPFDPESMAAMLEGDLSTLFPLFEQAQNGPTRLQDFADTALPLLREIGTFVSSTVGSLFLVLLIALLLMLEPLAYYRAIVAIVPRRHEARTVDILNKVRQNVITWLGGMLLSAGIATLLFLLVLGVIAGLPNALALSLVAGVATFVPTFGPIVALIPVAVVAAAESFNTLLLAVVLYAAVGAVQDRVVTPLIMKSELNIPAAGLVVFQLGLSAIIGPLGLLLAVPIMAILVTLVDELYVCGVLGKCEETIPLAADDDGTLVLKPIAPASPPPAAEAADTAAS